MCQYNVKVVHYLNSNATSNQSKTFNNTIHVNSSSYIDDHQDVVWFNNKQYKLIFGKTRATDSDNKLLAIVRITYKNRTIRRRYLCDLYNVPLGNSDLGLTSESVRILFDNSSESEKVVKVKKGNWIDYIIYYWTHPFHATRISFKVGFPALIISVVSLILSLFPN